jgi:hypothetical protein
MIKNICRKILKPQQRDYIRYKFIKFFFIIKFICRFRIINITNKSILRKLYKLNLLEKIIYCKYLFEYQKLFGSFKKMLNLRYIYSLLILKGINNFLDKNEVLRCLIYLEKFELAKLILKKIKNKKFDDLNFFIDLVNNNEKFIKIKPVPKKNFLKLIQNNNIAVVGSGNSNFEVGFEIDNYDIVVRTNYTNKLKLNPITMGSKTDVTYFNSATAKFNMEEILKLDDNIWKVFKNKNDYNLDLKYKKIKNSKYIDHHLKYLEFLGSSFNAIPNIVFDIIRYNPKKIKIFNSNFFYTGHDYNQSYFINNLNKNNYIFYKELKKHDPVFNYKIFQILLNNNNIELDKYSLAPFEAGKINYAKKLDLIFKSYEN